MDRHFHRPRASVRTLHAKYASFCSGSVERDLAVGDDGGPGAKGAKAACVERAVSGGRVASHIMSYKDKFHSEERGRAVAQAQAQAQGAERGGSYWIGERSGGATGVDVRSKVIKRNVVVRRNAPVLTVDRFLNGESKSMATMPMLKICTPPPDMYSMNACIGNDLTGEIANSHAFFFFSASCELNASAAAADDDDVEATTAGEDEDLP